MSKRSGFPGTRIAPISLTGAAALLAERAAAGPDRAGAGCSCFFWPAFWPERTLIVRAKADTNSNTIRPAKFDFIATPASQLAVHRQGEQLCFKKCLPAPDMFLSFAKYYQSLETMQHTSPGNNLCMQPQ